MNKRNYSAWQIDSREFNASLTSNEKLLYFARYAILAPSGHNSQPWLLTPAHESLLLTVNPDHHLSADGSGLLSVEPFISLGTFVETFVSAARGFGYMVNVTLFPEKHVVAKLQLGEICEAEPSLLNAIVRRVSNRNPFETQPLHTDILQRLVSRCPSGVAAHTVTTQKDIAFINEQTSAAIRSIMGKQAYRNELSTWVRGNLTRRFDGMPGFTHGFGLAASLMAKMAVKRGASPSAQVKKANSLIKNSGALLVIRATKETPEAFLNVGRCYARACIITTQAGLATSVLAASAIDAETRHNLARYFHLADRPIMVIRIGKPTIPARHGPRWPLEDVMTSQAEA